MREKLCLESEQEQECHACGRTDIQTCEVTAIILWKKELAIALVALEWLFSCVDPHHVHFQLTSFDAGKLACCASVRLFPRVGPFVLLQIA